MELLIEDLMTQLVEGGAVTCISQSASPPTDGSMEG